MVPIVMAPYVVAHFIEDTEDDPATLLNNTNCLLPGVKEVCLSCDCGLCVTPGGATCMPALFFNLTYKNPLCSGTWVVLDDAGCLDSVYRRDFLFVMGAGYMAECAALVLLMLIIWCGGCVAKCVRKCTCATHRTRDRFVYEELR